MAVHFVLFCNGKIERRLFSRNNFIYFGALILSFVLKISFIFNTLSLVYVKWRRSSFSLVLVAVILVIVIDLVLEAALSDYIIRER